MPGRVRIPRLDREREARDQALGLLQLLEDALQPDQRAEARVQLPRVDGLGEVVVRAGREPRHPRVQLALGGQEDHGDEVRHRVALELAAQVDPGDPRHPDVEQHQVRRLLGDLDERLLRGSDVAHRVAQVLDVVPHRLPDQEVVVDDQDVPEVAGLRVDGLTCHPPPRNALPACPAAGGADIQTTPSDRSRDTRWMAPPLYPWTGSVTVTQSPVHLALHLDLPAERHDEPLGHREEKARARQRARPPAGPPDRTAGRSGPAPPG